MAVLGPALGFFIGVLCGLAVLLLIRTAAATKATLKTTVAEISQLLAIPTFSFGGPWLTSQWLQEWRLHEVLPAYVVSLSVTFALVAGYPLVKLIVVTCDRMDDGGRS
jgi:hypothetical protein